MKYLGFESKPILVDSQSNDNSESGLDRIMRIVKKPAERQREKEKLNEAVVHLSSPLHPEKA